MFRSYLKIAWRSILKNKGFSLTNLLGLTIGMTCTVFILIWVQDELSWDKFHPDHKNIYRVRVNRNFNGEITNDISVPFPLANSLKTSFPEVKYVSVDNYPAPVILNNNNNIIKKKSYTTNPDFFKIFQWKFLHGSAETALSNPDNIVLTQSTAKALFGSDDVINKVISTDNHTERKVSAVVQDPPVNSTIQFDCILPFDYSSGFIKQASTDWVNCFSEMFVEVQPGTNIDQLGKKISTLVAKNSDNNKADYFLHAMDKWRLYSDFKNGQNTGGMIEYVRLFSIIAVIILVIACVNFMNLSTAKSEKRAKEVGIRKTLGSERKQLLLQFYSESMIFALLAFIFSLLLVYIFLPSFNTLIGRKLALPFVQPMFWIAALFIIAFTGVLSGSYPALYLSSFNPVRVLKGTFLAGKKAILPRKVLVVMQFAISILLISSTILVYQQIQHVKNRDLGYDPNNLISVPSSPDADKSADVIKNELMQSNLVASITRTSSPITEIWNFSPAPDWKGKPAGKDMIMTAMRADEKFAATIGTRVVMGRDFTNMPADSSAMILNKAALDLMQLKDPIGTEMRYGNRNYTVVGVTENVVMSSPYAPVMPMMIFLEKNRSGFFVFRLNKGVAPQAAIAKIGEVFKRYNPNNPFEYSFVDDDFGKKFVTEELIGKLTNLFAGLAIFICCLGLAGLTSFTIERRFKEIGIRKVLGASVRQLLYMISKEFLFLVSISFVISVPITWWLLNNWLQSYEYRTDISIWLFLISGASVLLLTLFIVCLGSISAAFANPIKNLRTE